MVFPIWMACICSCISTLRCEFIGGQLSKKLYSRHCGKVKSPVFKWEVTDLNYHHTYSDLCHPLFETRRWACKPHWKETDNLKVVKVNKQHSYLVSIVKKHKHLFQGFFYYALCIFTKLSLRIYGSNATRSVDTYGTSRFVLSWQNSWWLVVCWFYGNSGPGALFKISQENLCLYGIFPLEDMHVWQELS